MTTKIKASNIALGAITQDRLASSVTQGLFNYDTTITPEVLEIQANVDMSGQDATWLWTWTTSSLPYSRVDITTIAQPTVPLYAQGTYTINNFAAHELISGMSQTHALYLKWIEGAGTANNINWVTYVPNVSKTHPAINGGSATQVTQLLFQVPSTITPPTLVAPNISYNVTNNGTSAFTFMGNAHGDNPTIGPFYRGGTYTFNVNASGHPFYLTEDNGSGFQAGQYVDEYTSGVTGSRTTVGTVTFVVPNDAPDYLYYQCGNHAGMRGTIRIKDLALTQNDNGNYVVYLQHSQDNHVTPVELRPLPSLVNQMCLVYDASRQKWVPQDLATYIDRTPSVKNKIKEVTGAISAAGGATVSGNGSGLKIYPYANYLPLIGNNEGDIVYATDTEGLYVWSGSSWAQASGQVNPTKVSDQQNTSTGYFSLPKGTTAQRPVSPVNGMIRYNSTIGKNEVYDSDGWTAIASPPIVTTVSPSTFNGEQGTSFTVSGSAIDPNATIKFITASGLEYTAASVTRVSSSQILATTPRDFTVADEPLDVKVINGTGLSATLENCIDCGGVPTWNTAAGQIGGTIWENLAYTMTVSAGDPDVGATISYVVSSGTLPTGFTLNSSTGVISGTAPDIGTDTTYNFTIDATDNAGNITSRSFSIVVKAINLAWTTSAGSISSILETASLDTSVSASAASGTITYALQTGSLPSGIALSSSGTVTGTAPAVASDTTYTFTVRATHTSGTYLDRSFSITVQASSVTWNTTSGSIGSDYTQRNSSFSVSASTNAGSITYSIPSGSVPSGQSLNTSNGVISGTASGVSDYSNSTYNFTVRATNTAGKYSDRAFSINIASRYVGYSCSTAGENGTCSDTAPGSYVFNRVDFSSYGTPNGGCGSFSIGGCNSGGSNGYNPTPCKSYAVSASNNQWGDPCGGVGKRMYIQMSYGPF